MSNCEAYTLWQGPKKGVSYTRQRGRNSQERSIHDYLSQLKGSPTLLESVLGGARRLLKQQELDTKLTEGMARSPEISRVPHA